MKKVIAKKAEAKEKIKLLTWGELKKGIEELGVKDNEYVSGLDVYEPESKEDLFVRRDEIEKDMTVITIYGGA
jgi:hypothetical protein